MTMIYNYGDYDDDDCHFQLWGKPFDEHRAKQRRQHRADISRETETGF